MTDTGPGIDRSKWDSCSCRSAKGDASRTASWGTGMGLAVAYKLVDLMGGRMWVDSQIGSSTTLLLRSPSPRRRVRMPDSEAAGDPVQKTA